MSYCLYMGVEEGLLAPASLGFTPPPPAVDAIKGEPYCYDSPLP
jgi:hypothetical protein